MTRFARPCVFRAFSAPRALTDIHAPRSRAFGVSLVAYLLIAPKARQAPKAHEKVARGKGERSEPAAPGSPSLNVAGPEGRQKPRPACLSPLPGLARFL